MSGDDEVGDKSDLTRIEDLSEFLHQEDPDVDAQLGASDSQDSPPPVDELPGLDDLEEDEDFSMDDDSEEADFSMNEEETDFSMDDDDSEENDFSMEDDDSQEADFSMEDSESEESDFSTDDDDSDETDFSMDDDSEEADFSMNDDSEETDFSIEESDSEESELSMDEDSQDSEFSMDDDDPEEAHFSSDDDEDSEEEDFSADEIEPLQEVVETKTIQQPTYVDRSEKFEDVKSFAKNITYGKIAIGGNPAFSVILRNIKFEEDAEDILILLREHDIINAENEETMTQSIEAGSLLISQISEYAAIYLTHKFRRFDLDIQMGLSDELHPSKSYERDSVGLISKNRINQNKSETSRLEKSDIDLESIILSTTPTLENYKIVEYVGIVTEFCTITSDELTANSQLSELHERQAKGHPDDEETSPQDDDEIEINIGHNDIYQDLCEKLKPHCLKKKANAVVGINFQITPISSGDKYKISCSGSAVWVIDLD